MASTSGPPTLRAKLSQCFHRPSNETAAQKHIEVLTHTAENSLGFPPDLSKAEPPYSSPTTLLDNSPPSALRQIESASPTTPESAQHLSEFSTPPLPFRSHRRMPATHAPAWMHSKSSIDLGIYSNPQIKPPSRKKSRVEEPWTPCYTHVDNEDQLSASDQISRNRPEKLDDRTSSDVAQDAASLLYPSVAPLATPDRKLVRKRSNTNLRLVSDESAKYNEEDSLPECPATPLKTRSNKKTIHFGKLKIGISLDEEGQMNNNAESDSSSSYHDHWTPSPKRNDFSAHLADSSADWLEDPDPQIEEEFVNRLDPSARRYEAAGSDNPFYDSVINVATPFVPFNTMNAPIFIATRPQAAVTAVACENPRNNAHFDAVIEETNRLMSTSAYGVPPLNVQPYFPVVEHSSFDTVHTSTSHTAGSSILPTRTVSTELVESPSTARTSPFNSFPTHTAGIPPNNPSRFTAKPQEKVNEEGSPKNTYQHGVKSYIGKALHKVGVKFTKLAGKLHEEEETNEGVNSEQGNTTQPSATFNSHGEFPITNEFIEYRRAFPRAVIYRDENGFFTNQPRPIAGPDEQLYFDRLL